jgi:hypothetical protein
MTTPSSATPSSATPSSDMPQPRDIALEMETPEQAADLEANSEPEERPDGE